MQKCGGCACEQLQPPLYSLYKHCHDDRLHMHLLLHFLGSISRGEIVGAKVWILIFDIALQKVSTSSNSYQQHDSMSAPLPKEGSGI
jgi:hypothetical protein